MRSARRSRSKPKLRWNTDRELGQDVRSGSDAHADHRADAERKTGFVTDVQQRRQMTERLRLQKKKHNSLEKLQDGWDHLRNGLHGGILITAAAQDRYKLNNHHV